MHCTLPALLLCLFLPAGAVSQGEGTKKDQDALQGTWTFSEFVANGRPIPDEARQGLKLVFQGDKASLGAGNEADRRNFVFKLDPTKQPRTIDMTAQEGTYKDKVVQGIYELKGDELKLCLPNKDDVPRPTEFKAPENSRLVFMVLKRAK